jgi:GWxTD domain-containing protein
VHDAATHPALTASSSRTFTVRWSDLPSFVQDLDKAIDQLRYVARESEMEYMREAKDPTEKRRRFLEFWKKRDPDPRTAENELMEEYYARVDYANKNFTHYVEGWRTDRGMVYIYLGAPDNIERYPFQSNSKPYEIWYYNQINRRYVFVDESGFGDYRLRSPLTDLWDRVR